MDARESQYGAGLGKTIVSVIFPAAAKELP
jgi:hypothetical protein